MSDAASSFIVPFCERQHQVIYNDEQLLIVNKPHGLLSVPGRLAANKDCLISRVQVDYPTAQIVHRLDCDTSGLMVLALNKDSHKALSQLFQNRLVEKHYDAIVFGQLGSEKGQVELPIICDWPNRPKQKICHESGKKALTFYQRQHYDAHTQQSHVKLSPFTGRSHQLRIHMAEIGHPILGDDMYAHDQALTMASRLCLHASYLSFEHPTNQELMTFELAATF